VNVNEIAALIVFGNFLPHQSQTLSFVIAAHHTLVCPEAWLFPKSQPSLSLPNRDLALSLSPGPDLRLQQIRPAGARRYPGPAAPGAPGTAGVWGRACRARGLRQPSHAGGDGRGARLPLRRKLLLRPARPRQQVLVKMCPS